MRLGQLFRPQATTSTDQLVNADHGHRCHVICNMFGGGGENVPRLTLRYSGLADREEDTVSEYICDWPDCPNVAEHVLGCIRELRAFVVVCGEHFRMSNSHTVRAYQAPPRGSGG